MSRDGRPWDELDWWRERTEVHQDNGDRIKVICPNHEDSKPSLGITQIRPEKVVWRCYAGCPQDEVLESAGGEGFSSQSEQSEPRARRRPRRRQEHRTAPEVGDELDWLADYTATDRELLSSLGVDVEDGRIVYRVEGWANAKTRVPGTKEIAWLIKDGDKPPLWPTVKPRGDLPGEVWITEGETDAICLRAWGIEAYAILGGAKNPPPVEVWEELKDRGVDTIVVALDADSAGREGTAKLLRVLAEADVLAKIAKPRSYDPIGGQGKDWRDVRLRGEPRPVVTTDRAPKTFAKLKDIAREGVEWYVKGLAGRDVLTLVAGLPKAGKSTLVFNLLAALEDGEAPTFMGRDIRRRKELTTIYLSEEGAHSVVEKMQGRLEESTRVELQIDAARENEEFLETLNRVVQHARASDADLLVIDTVSAWAMLEDENSAADVTRTIQTIRVMTRGLGVILVHHANKGVGEHGTRVRGSGAWAATVDVIMELGFPDAGDGFEKDDLSIRKVNVLSRYEDLEAPSFIDKEAHRVDRPQKDPKGPSGKRYDPDKVKAIFAFVKGFLGRVTVTGGATIAEVHRAVKAEGWEDVSEPWIRRRLEAWEERGDLRRADDGRYLPA